MWNDRERNKLYLFIIIKTDKSNQEMKGEKIIKLTWAAQSKYIFAMKIPVKLKKSYTISAYYPCNNIWSLDLTVYEEKHRNTKI